MKVAAIPSGPADVLLFDEPLAHWTKIFFIFASMAGGVLRML